jgi:sugar lactone lactonase YvrE
MRKLQYLFTLLFAANLCLAQTRIITTIAGNGTDGHTGDGGPATAAKIDVGGIATDSAGNIYFSESVYIRKVDARGIISTIAGNGAAGYNGDTIMATDASLYYPMWIAVDNNGELLIADESNNRIRKVDHRGMITTVAGSDSFFFCGDGGPATDACIYGADGIIADRHGNMFFCDRENHRIRKVDTAGIITTIAGTGTYSFTGDGGPATAATFSDIYSIAVDETGNLFIADHTNNRIRKIDTTGIISTIAGTGTVGYSGDGGPATAADLKFPVGITVDDGNVYFVDQENSRIRMVDTTGIITTIAGNGTDGYSGDGGPATAAALNWPNSVHVDYSGNIYIGDATNARVRMIACILPTVSAIAGVDTVSPGATITLADTTATGIWSVAGTGIATVTATGLVTGINPGTDTIKYTVTNRCGSTSATKAIHVLQDVSNVLQVWKPGSCTVLPNPTTGIITICATEKMSLVEISNISGTVVFRANTGSTTVVTDLSQLPAGIYLARINGILVQKIAKQ